MDDLSNRLANFLLAAGVQKEERVALYAHRSSALVVGIMGILKSGATFTVVDPAYPVKRQIVYLQVAQPRAVVTLAAAGALDAKVGVSSSRCVRGCAPCPAYHGVLCAVPRARIPTRSCCASCPVAVVCFIQPCQTLTLTHGLV